MEFTPIGVIHTPYRELKGTPIQPTAAIGVQGSVELHPQYVRGLKDLEGFSHIILIYCFHEAGESALQVRPYLDQEYRGVFATRIPGRPNPIGLSVVRLKGVEGNRLKILDVDMLDGTPLLDIKPYIPEVDAREDARIGWLTGRVARMRDAVSDGRVI